MKIIDAENFLKKENLGVISTVNHRGDPESALVAFSENENLEIMIGTSKKSRKFQNIIKKPKVSITFGFDGDKTLQYEGKADLLKGTELKNKLKLHYKKQPKAKKYENDSLQVYMSIKPKWIRLSKSEPQVLGELRFGE